MPKGKLNPLLDVQVKVAEIDIVLRYSLRAVAIIQGRLGADWLDRFAGTAAGGMVDMATVDTLLEAGMHYHHGAPSEHKLDVMAEASGADLETLIEAIGRAISLAFPTRATGAAETDAAGPPQPASTSTS